MAEKLFKERYTSRNITARNEHKIAVLGGRSGIGKSRALLYLASEFSTWRGRFNTDFSWDASIFISFNNGCPPSIDALKEIPPAVGLALRLLYFGLLHKTHAKMSYQSFIEDILDMNIGHIDIITAIGCIELLCQRWYGEGKGMIFIAVDEVNCLHNESSEFLRKTMIALGQVVLYQKSFVYPVVAGTTVLPLDEVFRQLSVPSKKLPIGLFTFHDLEELMRLMEEANRAKWQGWQTCRPFRLILNDVACLPRATIKLFELIDERMTKFEETLTTIDWNSIHHAVSKIFTISSIVAPVACSILFDLILSSPVKREDFVLLNDESPSSLTYGKLEETGSIALDTNVTEEMFVHMPFALFRDLVNQLSGNDPLILALRNCFLLEKVGHTIGLTWQQFQDFHNNVEVVREMILARRFCFGSAEPFISINAFYGVDSLALKHLTFVPPIDGFILRLNCEVKRLSFHFPRVKYVLFQNILDDRNNMMVNPKEVVVRNVSGAVFDSFTYRETDDEENALICLQQKQYLTSTLTQELINEECHKVNASIESDVPKILVIAATRIQPGPIVLPQNTILLTGIAMETFYGRVLYNHAQLLASNNTLNINTANKQELLTVQGVRALIADRIIHERRKLRIEDWRDATDRIKMLPKSTEDVWEY